MAGVGRPRAFNLDDAVDAALALFWEQGYEGTSLSQLRSALGISSASFYAAFGSKEALFERALERYVAGPGSVTDIVGEVALPGREAVARMLHDSVAMQTDPSHPKGCLVALSGRAGGSGTPRSVRDSVTARRREDQARIARCVERAIERQELRADTDVRALTTAVHGFLLGMSTQIRDGAGAVELHRAADAVLLSWDAWAADPRDDSARQPSL